MAKRRIGWVQIAVGSFLALGAEAASPVRVELKVAEPAGVARVNEWVAFGVPFAEGAVKNVETLGLTADGRAVEVFQFTAQNHWPDGSVKWALGRAPLSVSANGEGTLVIEPGRQTAHRPLIKIEDGPDGIQVDTGAIQARINKGAFRLLDEVSAGGRPVLRQSEEAGAALELRDGNTLNMAAHPPEKVVVESAGPAHAVILARGRFAGAYVLDGDEMIRWTCRIHFHAGSDVVRIHYTLGNDGAYGTRMRRREYFQFNSLNLHFDMLNQGAQAVAEEASGAISADKPFVMRQKGADLRQADIFEARLGGDQLVASASRSAGALGVNGANGAYSVAIRDYWQNYPKESSAAPGRLSLALWPGWGSFPDSEDVYNLCGGKQKTHEILLRFGAGDLASAQALAAMVNRPLMPVARPEYYADTGAFVLLSPADVETGDAELDALIARYDALQRSKPAGITQTADRGRHGNYYNWMNWGDLFWAWGSSSLHYDWTHIMLAHFLRTGQRDFFDWGSAMARHQYDIDIHRSPRDHPNFRYLSAYEKEERGGNDWHVSRNPARMRPTTSHNWIQGQTLHALLTGDPESLACARINAKGIRGRLFGQRNLDTRPRRGQARSFGWAIECLIALHALTGEEDYLEDSRKIFENGLWHMFTEDGRSVVKWGGVQTAYCVRPLIDYHWYSGDDRAVDILKAIADECGEWRERFEYFMFGDAAAYVYYRTGEEAYLQQARELLGVLLKARGRFNPRSGAWTKSEAKTSRSAYKHIAIERLKSLGRAPVKP